MSPTEHREVIRRARVASQVPSGTADGGAPRLRALGNRLPTVGRTVAPRVAGRGQRGAGTVLVAIVAMALVVATWVAITVAGWFDCAHRARSAADLAALAGASAEVQGRDPCSAARDAAWRNGSRVVGCTLDGTAQSFVLHVVVSVGLRPDLPGAPRTVEADARAGSGIR